MSTLAIQSVFFDLVTERLHDCRCRNDVYHIDMVKELAESVCGGGTECINSRAISWKFVKQPSALDGLSLDSEPKFAWHCGANFPWYSPLIIHNVPNGIGSVSANGVTASMNADAGQQWALPLAALSKQEAVKQTVPVDITDVDGSSYGTFEIELDPSKVKSDCGSGKYASPASATGARPWMTTQQQRCIESASARCLRRTLSCAHRLHATTHMR